MTPSGLRTRSAAALGSSVTLAAFRVPGYPALWLSGAAGGFAWSVTQVAIGWLTLAASDSILAVGATFAVRLIPALLLGIPIGGFVDRHDRRLTLIFVNVAVTVPLVWAALVATNGTLAVTQLLLLSLALGVVDTLRGTATQTYSFDLVGAAGATNALALVNLGVFTAAGVGSIAGGRGHRTARGRLAVHPGGRHDGGGRDRPRRSAALEPGENARNRTWSRASRVR